MESLDYWRLCEQLNIIQAAILIVGEDPSGLQDDIERRISEERPVGYDAAKAALSSALLTNKIEGCLVFDVDENPYSNSGPATVDLRNSTVEVSTLKLWLMGRGFSSGFFFPDVNADAEYLDANHERYAPKLAAAVSAWMSFEESESLNGKSPKQALVKWLRLNGAAFGLADEDGKPNETGIEEVAKVANWQTKGGAPRTP